MNTTSILRLLLVAIIVCAAFVAIGSSARADDTADEAELHFQRGAERYQAGDFRGALEHFLQSNRLAPNRNVLFNAARCYEQLRQAPDAFRYYTQARDGETDPKTLAKIDEAIARIAPSVAVIAVDTEPPGATIYVDRKDLGARGNAPRLLGLPAGRYKIIVELPGYERGEAGPFEVQSGQTVPVKLALKQILGGLRVEGDATGAQIRVDREDGPVVDTVPATLNIPPGRHALFLSREGFKSVELPVEVAPNRTEIVRVKMEALTGVIVVNADVREALVTVDGQPLGFTPAVLNIPIGRHRLLISREGFRPFAQAITVSTDEQLKINAQLTTLEEVTAASRVTESVEDAPSSVTIINATELRAMAYPTIAEALRGVRGLYLSDDRSYATVGFRGFSRPGDYGNRVLVTIDGHPANDDYIEQSYVDTSGRVDLEDIERIEVVRGPGSVLYGSSAFFGVINLVTRSKAAPTHGEVGASTFEHGTARGRAMAHVNLGPNAGFWMSVAGAHGIGRDFFFQEFANDPITAGNARGVDGFDAATVHGRAWWRDVTVQWFLTSRKKTIPTGEYGTVLGNPDTHNADTRGFVEARYEPRLSDALQLLARAHADMYNFDGRFAYVPAQGGYESDAFRGVWFGPELRAIWTPVPSLRVTLGGEYVAHVRAEQFGSNQAGPLIDPAHNAASRDDPFSVYAGYANVDVTPTKSVKVMVGARYDSYSNSKAALSPRAAIIFKPYEGGNLKLMAGRAFRAPSVYELYYAGSTQLLSRDLSPETIWSGEVEYSHRFSSTVTALIAGYTNYVQDLISLNNILQADGSVLQQYQNATNPIQTLGAEAEVRREWRNGWMVAGTYSLQHSRFLGDTALLRKVPNSPEHLASFKGAVPLIGRALSLMTRITVEGQRYDTHYVVDPVVADAQTQTDPFFVWDLVFSGEAETVGVRWNLGAYNLTDMKYTTIPSVEFAQRQILQNGRTVLANVNVTF